MYTASDLRKGLKILLDGQPWVITEFSFMKPGKGQAIYNCRLKSMINGSTMTKSYRSNEKFEPPALEERDLEYSYPEGDNYIFMDENYEQLMISAEVLGNSRYFLNEGVKCSVLFFNNQPLEVTLPTFIEKQIIYTEPGARGDTATNVLKPARIEGDYELQVPLFVNQGDVIKIDTRTGEYADRVLKA